MRVSTSGLPRTLRVRNPVRRESVPPTFLTWLPAAGVGLMVVVWAALILAVEPVRVAVLVPRAAAGVEGASAVAKLFGALVLWLFPDDRARGRARWAAAAFLVLGLGLIVFGYLTPLLAGHLPLNSSIYSWLVVYSLAGALLVAGLLPRRAPTLTTRTLVIVLGLLGMMGAAAVVAGEELPTLALAANHEIALVLGQTPHRWLTGWHWALATIPLGLATATTVGAAVRIRRRWLTVAMALLAGSQLHNALWPSTYSPVLATADVLRLLFALTVATGGVVELKRLAVRERLYAAKLTELSRLKADFTSMVAHELRSPLAAIGGLADLLDRDGLDAHARVRYMAALRSELAALGALTDDVQAAATVERDDFEVHPVPIPLEALLADAAAFAATLPDAHPLTVIPANARVLADPVRIGQVLWNLLGNAAKYSPPGAAIEVRAMTQGRRVRIEVVDEGDGIHPEDLPRIFEKFARGRHQDKDVPGVGLGLYMSRQILKAHGSELTVTSTPGAGSVFGFELEVAR